jgi:hypothetical protein
MIDAKKYVPEIKKSKNKKYLNEKWNEVYSVRKKKVGKRKAIYSANATVYAELLKEWNSGNTFDRINTIWERKREREDYIFEKKGDYSIYPIDDMNVILTTDENVLRDYKKKSRKGLIKNIDDDYELEILDKVSEEYDIKLHPRLYYVMWSR